MIDADNKTLITLPQPVYITAAVGNLNSNPVNTETAKQAFAANSQANIIPASPNGEAYFSIASSSEDEEAKEKETRAIQEFQEMKIDYGFLDSSSPAMELIHSRLKILFPSLNIKQMPEVRVLAKHGLGVNAMVFENWNIILTPELIETVGFIEELDFVIMHEVFHLLNDDHVNSNKSEISSSVLNSIGYARKAEYKADAGAFHHLSQIEDSNPLGGVKLLERLKKENPKAWDLAHGNITDRILNLKTLTGLIELDSIEAKLTHKLLEDLTPIDTNLQKPLKALPKQAISSALLKEVPTSPREYDTWVQDVNDALKNVSIEALAYVVPRLYLDFVNHHDRKTMDEAGGKTIDPLSNAAIRYESSKAILKRVLSLIERKLDSELNHLDPESKALTKAFLLEVKFDIPAIKDPLFQSTHLRKNKEDLSSQVSVDFSKRAENFEKALVNTGINFTDKLVTILEQDTSLLSTSGKSLGFIENIMRISINNGLYDNEDSLDFTQFLKDTKRLLEAAQKHDEKFAFSSDEQQSISSRWTRILTYGILSKMDLEEDRKAECYQECLDAIKDFEQESKTDWSFTTSDFVDNKEAYAEIYPEYDQILQEIIGDKAEGFVETKIKRLVEIQQELKTLQLDPYLNDATSVRLMKELRSIFDSLPKTLTEQQIQPLLDNEDKGEDNYGTMANRFSDYSREQILKGYLNEIFHSEPESENANSENLLAKVHLAQILCDSSESYLDIVSGTEYTGLEINTVFEIADNLTHFSKDLEKVGIPKFQDSQLSIQDAAFETFCNEAFIVLLATLEKFDDKAQYFKLLEVFCKKMPFPLEIDNKAIREQFTRVLNKGIAFLDLEQGIQGKEMDLLLLSFIIVDPTVSRPIQSFVTDSITKNKNLQDTLQFCFEEFPLQNFTGSSQTFKTIVNKARTPEELELLINKVKERLDLQGSSLTRLGEASAYEGASQFIYERNESRVVKLLALLQSSHDETELKQLIVRQCSEGGDWDNKIQGKKYQPNPFVTPESTRNTIYRLQDIEKLFLLRKLLSGHKGVLETQTSRQQLLSGFLATYLTPPKEGEDTIASIVKEVLKEMMLITPGDELSLVLSSLLRDKIANPPKQLSSWREEAIKILEDCDRDKLRSRNPQANIKVTIKNDDPRIPGVQKLMGEQVNENEDIGVINYSPLLEAIGENNNAQSSLKFTPLQMTLEFARNFGAPGVRFLQLLGQAVDLPEDMQKEFSGVYDAIEGQNKLTAWQTIKRYSPEYASQIKELGNRIGGGSLFSVFEVILNNGTREVVRILNPNASYHTSIFIDIAKKAVNSLAKRNPQYALALPLVDLIEEWISKELQDQAFFDQDKEFAKWQDWKPSKKFGSSIRIPKSQETSNGSKIRREEFINGFNLTEIEKVSDPNKRKELIALAVQHYMAQIKGLGVLDIAKPSFVHSDISAGNLRIDDDMNLAILDRGMFLEFNLEDKLFLRNLASEQNPKAKAEIFLTWLQKLEGNSGKDLNPIRTAIYSKLDSDMELEKLGTSIMIEARKHGFKIPLKYTLLFKNLNALGQLSRKVGFKSLQEALVYTP